MSNNGFQCPTASLVTLHQGKVIAAEIDPAIVPSQNFVEEMIRPTARWRLGAYDEHGHREPFLDTLLADPFLLASDEAGVIVGDHKRAHMRDAVGHWTSVEGLNWPTGIGADALVSLTQTHAIFAQSKRPSNGKPYSSVSRLDRRSGIVEELPALEEVTAIGASEQFLAWAPFADPSVKFRPLLGCEPITRIPLPSRARRLSWVGRDLVIVLEQGFGVLRDGILRVWNPEHCFIRVWPASDECWYGLLSGKMTISPDDYVERVGACLCRMGSDELDILWAEVPPSLDEEFEIGAPISFAVDESRVFFAHAGRIESVAVDGEYAQPVLVSGHSPQAYDRVMSRLHE